MAITVEIQVDDKASKSAAAIRDELQRPDVKRVMGRAIVAVIKHNFEQLAADSTHHTSADSLGAGRTGFYERAGKAVQQPNILSDGFSVSINQVGIAQRLFGGVIEPVNAKFLTIPARTESYGKRAGEFDNLRAIIFPGGQRGALVQREASVLSGSGSGGARVAGLSGTSKGDKMGGGVFFWLVKRVVQHADPDVLPKEQEMLEPAIDNARAYVERIWQREAA